MKAKQYVFTETGEVRTPEVGEWYAHVVNGFVRVTRAPEDHRASSPILRCEVREVEIEEPVPEWAVEAARALLMSTVENKIKPLDRTSLARHFFDYYRRAKERGDA